MKRIALAFMALALVGTAAFADAPAPAPTFNLYANDGLIVGYDAGGTTQPATTFSNAGLDYGQGAPGPLVYATVGVTGANFGWSVAPGIVGKSFFFDHYYAYVKPVDGLTLITGQGITPGALFNDLDPRGTNGFKSGGHSSLGGWYTVAGFSVGAVVAPTTAAINGTPILPVFPAVNYTSKLFALNAYGSNDSTASVNQYHITGSLTAVENLTVNAGYNVAGLVTSGPWSLADASISYAFGPLTIGVVGAEVNPLGVSGTSNSVQYFLYKPNVTYTVNKAVTVSAYLIGDTSNTVNYEPLGQVAWTPVDNNTIKVAVWGDTNPKGTAFTNYSANDGTGAYTWLSYYGWTAVVPGFVNASVDYIFTY